MSGLVVSCQSPPSDEVPNDRLCDEVVDGLERWVSMLARAGTPLRSWRTVIRTACFRYEQRGISRRAWASRVTRVDGFANPTAVHM